MDPRKEKKISTSMPNNRNTHTHIRLLSQFIQLYRLFFDDTAKWKPPILAWTAVIEIIYMAKFQDISTQRHTQTHRACQSQSCHIIMGFNLANSIWMKLNLIFVRSSINSATTVTQTWTRIRIDSKQKTKWNEVNDEIFVTYVHQCHLFLR